MGVARSTMDVGKSNKLPRGFVKAEVQGKGKDLKLVIEIPLNTKPVPSKTGKTMVVASTHGNQPTQALFDGKPITIGLNAYIKP